MSRTLKEMAAELGMFLASIGLLACVAVVVFDLALVDYGPASEACPATTAADTAGTASISVLPPGITCTWDQDGATTSTYVAGSVPLALGGALACLAVVVLLRRVSLRLQSRAYRERDPLYAEDLVDELERRRHRAVA